MKRQVNPFDPKQFEFRIPDCAGLDESFPSSVETEAFQQHKLNLEYPCHNQALKRHIKLVSEASAAVGGFKNRDGLTRQKIDQEN